jgi:perosamine synthetase
MILVNEPVLDGNERKYLLECIESGWISSEGPFVRRFEEAMSGVTARRHAMAVSNGTAAIDAAVEALGIGPGDEVILPSFTIISCVLQIVRAGATPIFVDCDPRTYNVTPEAVIERISDRTKAIMLVHIYGLPVDMDPILAAAATRGIFVVEDAAEAIGQTYKNRPCGSFGDVSCLSFYPNKHVTTGEGGMVLTNSDSLASSVRELRNLCFVPGKRFVHERLGWNLRMTNLQAAVGLAQTERLDEFVDRKRHIGGLYSKLLSGLPGVQLPIAHTDYAENIYWVYPLVLNDGHELDAKEAMSRLREKSVDTRPFFFPLHEQPALLNGGLSSKQDLPVSSGLYQRGFYIPSGLALTDAQAGIVAEALWEILG